MMRSTRTSSFRMPSNSGKQSRFGLHTVAKPTRSCHAIVAAIQTDAAVSQQVEALIEQHKTHEPATTPLWNELRQLGADLGLETVVWDKYNGFYEEVTTTYLAKAAKAGNDASVLPLGQVSFNCWKPVDLKLEWRGPWYDKMQEELGLSSVYKGPFRGIPSAQVFFQPFRVIEADDTSSSANTKSPLLGLQTVSMEAVLAPAEEGSGKPSKKVNITFKKLRLELWPGLASNPDVLARWLSIFKAANPSMGDDGVAEFEFGKMPSGFNDYLLFGDEYQVHQGNMGSYYLLKRYQPPADSYAARMQAHEHEAAK